MRPKAFSTYKQMLIEHNIIEHRIQWLDHRIEQLNMKYLSLRSNSIIAMPEKGGVRKDKAVEYANELYFVKQANGMTIAEEYEYQKEELNQLSERMLMMQDNLKKLDGVHATLYKAIVFDGMPPAKAVKVVGYTVGYAKSAMYKFLKEIKPYMVE